TIGCEPATSVSLGAGASATGALSLTDGLACGRVAACLVSVGFDAPAFGVAASGRGSPRLASAFGFGGAGGGVAAVVSVVPPMPILRARLLKNHRTAPLAPRTRPVSALPVPGRESTQALRQQAHPHRGRAAD